MNLRQFPSLLLISLLPPITISFTGCTTVEETSCGNDSFFVSTTNNIISPNVISKTESSITYDFGNVITAKPIIKASGPAKAKIKYRTYSNAADAVESAFELPDLEHHERATDLMDRIIRVTATYESEFTRKFRFLDIELSNKVDILKAGGVPISSQASFPHQRGQPSKP